jgi:hypothetical protein
MRGLVERWPLLMAEAADGSSGSGGAPAESAASGTGGSSGADGSTSTGGPPPTSNEPSALEWRNLAPEEYRDAEELKRAPDLPTLLKSYVEAERRVRSSVQVPKPDAPESVWRSYYKKVGVPDAPDAYELKDPEPPADLPDDVRDQLKIDPDFRARLVATGHKAGLMPHQMQAFVDLAGQVILDAYKRQQGMSAMQEAEMKEELARVHGANSIRLQQEASLGLQHFARGRFGGEYAQRFLEKWNNSDWKYDPDALVVFSEMYRQLAEGQYVDDGHGSIVSSADQVDSQIAELRTVFMDDSKPMDERLAAQHKAQTLYEQKARLREDQERRANRHSYVNSR